MYYMKGSPTHRGPLSEKSPFREGWKSGWQGLQDWKREQEGPPTMIPLAAGFDPGNRRPIYDKNGRLIQQRPILGGPILGDKQSHIPVPIMDYVGNRTASVDDYDYDFHYQDQYYNDYEDDYHDNIMRDDYYVQDPFSEIWGNQGGPLYFG